MIHTDPACGMTIRARRLNRATMRNIRQDLFLAFVYNAVGVPVAAAVLYTDNRHAHQPDLGERGDDAKFGLSYRQRAAVTTRPPLMNGNDV